MSSSYERLNLAQSVATGPHGRLIRLVSRIAMLTIEVPAAMRAGDWPEQRRIRGDLDEALARLSESRPTGPPSLIRELQSLTRAGQDSVAAIVRTPRGSEVALEQARSASAEAVRAAEAITDLLEEPGAGSSSLVDS